MFLPPFNGPILAVGDHLRALRRLRRLSQARLARTTGLDLETVVGLERSRGTVPSLIKALAALDGTVEGCAEPMAFGSWLVDLRKARGLPQRAAAELAGLSQPTLIKLEHGHGRIDSFAALLLAYGLPLRLVPRSDQSGSPCPTFEIIHGDAAEVIRGIPAASISAVVTDPPYALGDLTPSRVSEIVKAWVDGRDYDFSGYRSYMADQWLRRDWDNGLPQPSFWREVHRILKPGAHTLVFAAPRTADLVALSLRLAGFEIRDTIVWVHRQGFGMGMNVARTLAMREVRSRLSEDERRNLHSRRRRFPSRAGRAVGREGLALDREGILEIAPDVAPLLDQFDGVSTKVRPAHETIIVARKPRNGSVAESALRHGVGGVFVKPTRTHSLDGKRRYPSNVVGDLGEEHQPFFFAPKAMPEERDRHLPPGMRNTHHAVKPIELLRWLIRLVTPTAGTVLDPFAGSGSTGC